jgi:DNA-binding transcriptional MerR regulator
MPRSGIPAEKSDLAFRTISEASEIVGVPQHVLRFWETRFPQLQPIKRGGNRRYYRPADMALLESIRAMLHDQGLTIRGAKLALAGESEAKPRRIAAALPASQAGADPVDATMPTSVNQLAALRAIRDRLRLALAA